MKNKFVGLLLAWGAQDWIEAAIKQALYACDEVIVSIGAHSKAMMPFEDQTLKLAQKFKDKIKFCPVVFKNNHAETKAATMNQMLTQSPINIGDWVWLLDVDEFYFKKDIDDLKHVLLNSEFKSAVISSKFFYINMQHHMLSSHNRLWKVTSKKFGFRPTNNWIGETLPGVTTGNMFHYSLLLNHKAKKAFWSSEYKGKKQNNKTKWLEEIYLKFDLNDQDTWLNKNLELFNKLHPFANSSFTTKPYGRLFEYKGEHPEWIQKLGYTKINDWRKLY